MTPESTTVMATMRMVAITGLTAASSSTMVSTSSSSSARRLEKERALTKRPARATAITLGANEGTELAPMVSTTSGRFWLVAKKVLAGWFAWLQTSAVSIEVMMLLHQLLSSRSGRRSEVFVAFFPY